MERLVAQQHEAATRIVDSLLKSVDPFAYILHARQHECDRHFQIRYCHLLTVVYPRSLATPWRIIRLTICESSSF